MSQRCTLQRAPIEVRYMIYNLVLEDAPLTSTTPMVPLDQMHAFERALIPERGLFREFFHYAYTRSVLQIDGGLTRGKFMHNTSMRDLSPFRLSMIRSATVDLKGWPARKGDQGPIKWVFVQVETDRSVLEIEKIPEEKLTPIGTLFTTLCNNLKLAPNLSKLTVDFSSVKGEYNTQASQLLFLHFSSSPKLASALKGFPALKRLEFIGHIKVRTFVDACGCLPLFGRPIVAASEKPAICRICYDYSDMWYTYDEYLNGTAEYWYSKDMYKCVWSVPEGSEQCL